MKTILAIAISAAFCYSSYALSAEIDIDNPSTEDAQVALEILTQPSDTLELCAQQPDSTEETFIECISNVNSYALRIVVNYTTLQTRKECVTRSREIFTF